MGDILARSVPRCRHVDPPRTSLGPGLVALIVGCTGIGLLGALSVSTGATQGFYLALVRPSWAPPPWLFGPACTTLYTLMAIATWLIWRHTSGTVRQRALTLFGVQLALNLAWTPVFFGRLAIGAAVIVIIANLIAVIATAVGYGRRVALAGWLLVPLALWVGFATAHNIAIWQLSR